MNVVQRALRALTGWSGMAGPYVDVGPPHLPMAEPADGCGNSWQAAASLPALLRCISLYSDQLASLPRAWLDATTAARWRMTAPAIQRARWRDRIRGLGRRGARVCTDGNGYLRIPRNDRGGPMPLRWIPTARVSVEIDERNRVWYRVARRLRAAGTGKLLPEAAWCTCGSG